MHWPWPFTSFRIEVQMQRVAELLATFEGSCSLNRNRRSLIARPF